jgi:hypothetical protein
MKMVTAAETWWGSMCSRKCTMKVLQTWKFHSNSTEKILKKKKFSLHASLTKTHFSSFKKWVTY